VFVINSEYQGRCLFTEMLVQSKQLVPHVASCTVLNT